jgi:hypothetical protein
MIKILPGRRADSLEEATLLTLREAGKGDLSPDIAAVFASVIDDDKLYTQAEKSVNAAVRSRYGRSARWSGKWWFIPVPHLRYDASPIPLLAIEVQGYVVSAVEIKTLDYDYSITLVDVIGKPRKLLLPMPFLQAILNDDLDQFDITGKDGTHTVWSIPGLKEAIRLPDDFTTKLSGVLRLKTVAGWLQNFGSEGKKVTP